jgi:hypothetical protein
MSGMLDQAEPKELLTALRHVFFVEISSKMPGPRYSRASARQSSRWLFAHQTASPCSHELKPRIAFLMFFVGGCYTFSGEQNGSVEGFTGQAVKPART